MLRLCKDCNIEKDIDEFLRWNNYRHNKCNSCRKAYTKKINDKVTAKKRNFPLW